MEKRVTALGGVFITCNDPKKSKDWYSKHLGLQQDDYGINFKWKKPDGGNGYSVFSFFEKNAEYLKPSKADYMLNFRVQNIEKLVEELKTEGVEICDEIAVYDYGKFVHIIDCDGNKIELWESVDSEFDAMTQDNVNTFE